MESDLKVKRDMSQVAAVPRDSHVTSVYLAVYLIVFAPSLKTRVFWCIWCPRPVYLTLAVI